MPAAKIPRILIVGGGFAGLSAARFLSSFRSEVSVTLLDKKTTWDFLPLLPDTIGRGLPLDFVQYPLSRLSREWGFLLLQEEVISLSLEAKEVVTLSGRHAYDYLVIASGSQTNFYGNDNIAGQAYKLDEPGDAARLTRHLKSKNLQNYIVCGGGYTGIEVATNLRKFLERSRRQGKIIIVERAPAILGPLPQWMKEYVSRNLERLDIEVLVSSGIEKIAGESIAAAQGKSFESAMVIWAAGVKTAPFIQELNAQKSPQGRLQVDEFLRLKENCFVAGDASYYTYAGNFLRMSVQFAMTQGECAARNIMRTIKGKHLQKFIPRDPGYIVPMANNISCGLVLGVDLKGRLATFLHFLMCAYRSYGWRNKFGIIGSILR